MYFLNALQHVKYEHYLRYHQIQTFFLLIRFFVTWIISFGELLQRWTITNSRGYYGIYGKVETIRCLVIWIWIQGKHFD